MKRRARRRQERALSLQDAGAGFARPVRRAGHRLRAGRRPAERLDAATDLAWWRRRRAGGGGLCIRTSRQRPVSAAPGPVVPFRSGLLGRGGRRNDSRARGTCELAAARAGATSASRRPARDARAGAPVRGGSGRNRIRGVGGAGPFLLRAAAAGCRRGRAAVACQNAAPRPPVAAPRRQSGILRDGRHDYPGPLVFPVSGGCTRIPRYRRRRPRSVAAQPRAPRPVGVRPVPVRAESLRTDGGSAGGDSASRCAVRPDDEREPDELQCCPPAREHHAVAACRVGRCRLRPRAQHLGRAPRLDARHRPQRAAARRARARGGDGRDATRAAAAECRAAAVIALADCRRDDSAGVSVLCQRANNWRTPSVRLRRALWRRVATRISRRPVRDHAHPGTRTGVPVEVSARVEHATLRVAGARLRRDRGRTARPAPAPAVGLPVAGVAGHACAALFLVCLRRMVPRSAVSLHRRAGGGRADCARCPVSWRGDATSRSHRGASAGAGVHCHCLALRRQPREPARALPAPAEFPWCDASIPTDSHNLRDFDTRWCS